MSRRTHYSPCINRELVRALYHEARHRRKPMTRLVDELLLAALNGTTGWQIARATTHLQEHPDNDQRHSPR